MAQPTQKNAKPVAYKLTNWNTGSGLPNDNSNVMIKAADGFIWIGNGVGDFTRFNGRDFMSYNYDRHKNVQVSFGQILALKEDSLKNIWIGTENGLYRYDVIADSFSNIASVMDTSGLKKRIIPFSATKEEMYCVGDSSVILAFDVHTLKVTRSVKISEKTKIHPGYGLNYSVYDTSNSSVWILSGIQEGLVQVSLSTGKSLLYRNELSGKKAMKGQISSEAMCYDARRNCIWINAHDGLFQFNLGNLKFKKIEALNAFTDVKDYGRWVGIELDNYGRVWLATQPGGVLIYDPETDQCKQLYTDKELIKKTGEANLHIYCDRDGIIWFTYWSQEGINQLSPYQSPVKRYLANPEVPDSLSNAVICSIKPADKGKVWIGTKDGLNIFDTDTEKFEVLRQADLPGLKGEGIIPLYVDTLNQVAWLCTVSKLPYDTEKKMQVYEMNLKTRKCERIRFMDGAKEITWMGLGIEPGLVRPYRNGILVCTDYFGLFKIEPGKPVANLHVPARSKFMFSAVSIVGNHVFIRSYLNLPNYHFVQREEKWERRPHLMDSLEWDIMLYEEKSRTYWVSFKNSLVHYNEDFRELKKYGYKDGYRSPFYKMLIDGKGNIWFVNNLREVGRFNMQTGNFTILSESDGYYKKDFDWSAPLAIDSKGTIYVGTGYGKEFTGGLDLINTEKYFSLATSVPYLDSISINNRSFPLATSINHLKALELDYNQNNLKIVTGVIDYTSNGNNKVRYKLEAIGKESDWQLAADDTIRFDGLAPGKYHFVLQSSNAGLEFNSPEKILSITINPPFWATWWFRVLAGLVLVASIYGIVQMRSRNLKQRNTELERKVLHRTIELKHSLEELRETQEQLIHREKMASLGELTAGIAHEIQNPLNFVNNFSEVNAELIDEAKEELKMGNLDEMEMILNDIQDNGNKILLHGKRADAIVKGMLQHSRISSGQKEPTDINALADEYLRLSFHGLRAKDKSFNATLETDFDETIGKVNIIPQDIGRVLLNLYNNAFYAVMEKKRHAPAEYVPTVQLSTKKTGQGIEISVMDNGTGIPEKVREKIFQPFFTTKPTGQGTGLGLSLSYDIVRAHGGDLKVETKDGEGSVFMVSLPDS
jgi:signal transduction histidine kinase/streptogramin lyase